MQRMTTKQFCSITILFALALLPLTATAAEPRDEQWKQVEAAVKKGLPKTAIGHLEPIIAGAIKDKAYAEAIKAIGRKIALQGNIQGNKAEENIVRMQAEIAKAPKAMVPVMDAILANWYWHYFRNNRWRFMQRTTTAAPPGNDLTTWDLPQLFAEIDKQFGKALSAAKVLQAIPVADYDELLTKGTMPDSYRPTMYDFLAHNAIDFYNSGEQAAAKAQDAFDLMADSPIFSSADDFLGWKIETTDERSPKVRAIRLYQDLMRFHKGDDDQSAFLDANLLRLNFGSNKAFGEEKNDRYKAALKRFADKWAEHKISARAIFQRASVLRQESKLVEAHQLAKQGANRFPNSVGGKFCYNLVAQIEAKSSSVNTERVWNDPLPTIQVRYRNLTKVYFRAVAYDWQQLVKRRGYQPEQLNPAERKALLAKQPALAWSADLPATDDFQERAEEIPAPKDLQPGFYYLAASHDPKFGASNNRVTFTGIWVSDLALVMRTRSGQGVLGGFVLDANSGNSVAGAQVRSWLRNRNNTRSEGPSAKTNKDGLFRLTVRNNSGYAIHVRHGDQQLSAQRDYYNYARNLKPQPYSRTVFFTDRALYRPGQTIQYKGLCIDVDQNTDNYKVLAGQVLTVLFADRNGKEIAKQQHRSNDYGSFNGSFTAPRDRLMGRMSLRVMAGPRGTASFSVEEYKRPKFEVKLAKPKVAAKLNAQVDLQGTATAYTGAAIGGAKVRYRVVRQVRYPIWWRWYYWWRSPRQNSQEIAHGTVNTASNGTFPIQFTAKPDLSVAEKDEPTFQFTVYADVTDITGETRSAQVGVNVGYTALQAALAADEWQTDDKPVKVTVTTQTLDGEGQAAKGTLKIYRLKQPAKVERPKLTGYRPMPIRRGGKIVAPAPDNANPNSWPLGDVVAEKPFTIDGAGNAEFSFKLAAGPYRATLETQDRFGKPVTAQLPIRILNPDAKKFEIKIPHVLAAPSWSTAPNKEFTALWGSGYKKARVYIEIEHRRKLLQSYWTESGQTQVTIKQAVTEAMRGGFTLHVTMVRENRAYLNSQKVAVPWTNKNLTVKWEHFVSKLEPNQKETWTAVITGPNAKKVVAEMVATLYDESLDAYLKHRWQQSFGVFRTDYSNLYSRFENGVRGLQYLHGNWPVGSKSVKRTYRTFPRDIIANIMGYQFLSKDSRLGNRRMLQRGFAKSDGDANGIEKKASATGAADKQAGSQPDLSKVAARKNLNETAFFFPHLISDKDGVVKLQFTMPEALTKWKFFGFTHDKNLRSGFLESSTVTAKELMVQPNPPRFLREGDELEFTVKVSNQSATRQTGIVRLTLADARTEQSVDRALGNTQTDRSFDIPSKESRSLSWRLKVPDEMGFLTYKAVGSTGRLSDGESGFLPVLSRRILVAESLPLPIRGAQTKKFDFTRLIKSGASKTLRHQNLTVQMVSNPTWYAVMALPYLMEYPHQCTEQTFNRLYANSLARHVANSDPKIRRIFDLWKAAPALDSPLAKNQDLKAVMLEETPWLRQGNAESQARRNVGILFDDNRLNTETAALLRKLAELQMGDGAWPWFPGGRANDYITLYITTGFGRMRHLGVDIDTAVAVKALNRLDSWIDRIYRQILKNGNKDKNHLSTRIALYLYCRSFFLADKAVDAKHQPAIDYFLDQARKHWLKLANRQSQAHLAVALKRFGDKTVPQDIMRSIKERSVSNEELGMFWRELELSWWWYRAPIETQAMMIEAFDEVMNDADAVEDCKVWLLKQKQTQDWKTTKATADAVYALLLRGTNGLVSDALVEVTLGGTAVKPENVEAGTGFYEKRFVRGEVKPKMGEIVVKKVNSGVAWGSVHWQYLEDISKITPYDGTPLKLRKTLFTKELTKKGPVLQPVDGAIKVGDELIVRIELRVDRDMEFLHLKDQRGSGTEPVNVLSRYKYQDGLAYYESTRDTASHFFIDYLPKGVYVFEYSTRVVHKGEYQTGMAQIQCMYAPEFNSHSKSFRLDVK